MKKTRILLLSLATLYLIGCASASYQIHGTNNDYQQKTER